MFLYIACWRSGKTSTDPRVSLTARTPRWRHTFYMRDLRDSAGGVDIADLNLRLCMAASTAGSAPVQTAGTICSEPPSAANALSLARGTPVLKDSGRAHKPRVTEIGI